MINSKMPKINHIHLVGIGGSGMCGIAEVLHNSGYKVSGSDLQKSNVTDDLADIGITVFIGHKAENIAGADVLVTSSAVTKDNIEVVTAHQHHILVVPRAEMLAELMRYRYGIAVAGTHGKTTTTSLLASVFAVANLDPTFVIGGKLSAAHVNAKLGASRYLIAEADESDASFLHLQPAITIVTNIDSDHMDTYDGDFELLKKTFIDFIHNLPFYGLAVLCIDEPSIRSIIPHINRRIITYGLSDDADIRATDIYQDKSSTFFTLHYKDEEPLKLRVNMPGVHNVLNALAVIAVAKDIARDEEEISDTAINQAISEGLANFTGVGRRFEVYGDLNVVGGKVMLVDDYGHHPREVKAVIDAIRGGWADRRLVMVYQPHRFSRTRDLYDDFVKVLSTVDALFLMDVYPAGEAPIVRADSRSLVSSIRSLGKIDPIYLDKNCDLVNIIASVLRPNDILLCQGAGDIGRLAAILLDHPIFGEQ